MINEVRRQFRDLHLLDAVNPGTPDYRKCVDISTKASLIEMIIPGVMAICAPLVCGFVLGREALGGMLIGALVSGFMLAIFMANAGGAWDKSKKWIEVEGLGDGKGKGTKYHTASIVGDTIGDPFKDTSGPSLNILIKLMTMMSIVFAPIYPMGPFDEEWWWVGLIIFVVFMALVLGMWFWMRSQKIGHIDFEEVNTIPAENGAAVEMESLVHGGDGDEAGTQGTSSDVAGLQRQLAEARKEIANLKAEKQ